MEHGDGGTRGGTGGLCVCKEGEGMCVYVHVCGLSGFPEINQQTPVW